MARPVVDPKSVFLNIPCDRAFRNLSVAYIVGIYQFELKPQVTLGIPGGARRLDRILDFIQSCPISIHDLSWVELDHTAPATPRFDLPFELGLAVASAKARPIAQNYFVFETQHRRIQKSLSDLDGTDLPIHGGTVRGVMSELCHVLAHEQSRPTVPGMMKACRFVSGQLAVLAKNAGASSIFTARVFEDLCVAAKFAADEISR